jgi:hypothetical protein
VQIVADVKTRRYSLFLGLGDYFWRSYEENQAAEISPYNPPYKFKNSKPEFCMGELIFRK